MVSDLIYRATIAGKCGRYHEMVAIANTLVKSNPDLSPEERGIFSEAYRQAIGKLRTSSRLMDQIYKKKSRKQPHAAEATLQYKRHIDGEIQRLCQQGLDMLKHMDVGSSQHHRLFVAKERADIHRYLAEVDPRSAPEAERAYDDAMQKADQLPIGDPLRLATQLNFAIFQHEVGKNTSAAVKLLERLREERPDPREESLIQTLIAKNLRVMQQA
eukprot:Blabericola_migrator_1__4069@NODE_223_length_11158_cov_141_106032_g189_i0_p7_GENE_NODE_223_length_11158_cov_141_106032_g189_i0NODE_223_length_11158_cov_141_106032_g189_i0_p7_ORF_typecomplete_len215_score34_881433/PF00244_20/6_9e32TPR_19/PF14559_6/1_7e03TPR_19/PF14559_6/2_3e03TPR_19/PF14559_6/0_014TPR_6/PF13174_6/84TPR_6/PF13174_6/5_5e03TPR_6/PF13174_6/1_1e04TPR_6/PF13174_6/1_1Erythro_esteras/PF05139_14/0_0087_NODE_223_length_11158_cov_141_106032_g189_i0942010064